jgi:hypothetical protein
MATGAATDYLSASDRALKKYANAWQRLLDGYRRLERSALITADLKNRLDVSTSLIQQARDRLAKLQIPSLYD